MAEEKHKVDQATAGQETNLDLQEESTSADQPLVTDIQSSEESAEVDQSPAAETQSQDEESAEVDQSPATETQSQEDAKASELNGNSLNDLILQYVKADEIETEKECSQANQSFVELGIWLNRQKELTAAVRRLRDAFGLVMEKHNGVEQSLPPETLEVLSSRRESINLCIRMLGRLTDRMSTEIPQEMPGQANLLSPLSESELKGLLADDSIESAEPKSKQVFRERRIANQKSIADIRTLTDAAEKKLVNTAVRQLLPIIDGLDEGKKISESMHADLCARFPENSSRLEEWLSVYDDLINASLNELMSTHIQPMSINRGDPVNYEFHEPLDVEEDPELADEQVKEVARRGYTALDADGSSRRILRPGQVVVVKNSPIG